MNVESAFVFFFFFFLHKINLYATKPMCEITFQFDL